MFPVGFSCELRKLLNDLGSLVHKTGGRGGGRRCSTDSPLFRRPKPSHWRENPDVRQPVHLKTNSENVLVVVSSMTAGSVRGAESAVFCLHFGSFTFKNVEYIFLIILQQQ